MTKFIPMGIAIAGLGISTAVYLVTTQSTSTATYVKENKQHVIEIGIPKEQHRHSALSHASRHQPTQTFVLTEPQQQQVSRIKRLYGQQKKKLLKLRKSLSEEDFKAHVAAIKKQYQIRLAEALGESVYKQYQQQLTDNRLARARSLKEHTEHHILARQQARRKAKQ